MLGKVYTSEEVAKVTTLICNRCGKEEPTDPTSNKVPLGWAKRVLIVGFPRRMVFHCSECNQIEKKQGFVFPASHIQSEKTPQEEKYDNR